MKKILGALLIALPSLSYSASANEIYNLLLSADLDEKMQAARYLDAVRDSQLWSVELEKIRAQADNRKPNFNGMVCIPDRVQLRQVVDIVQQYFAKNPANRHNSAAQQAHLALLEVWRCEK